MHVYQKCDHVSDSFLFLVSLTCEPILSLLLWSTEGFVWSKDSGSWSKWWLVSRVTDACLCKIWHSPPFFFSGCLVSFMLDFESAFHFQRDFELRVIHHLQRDLAVAVCIGLSSPFYNNETDTGNIERCHDNRARCVREYYFEPVTQPSCCQ